MKTSTSQLVLLLGAALFLSACVKDKDIDDYKREKAQKDLAQLQAIEGSYTGLIVDSRNKKILGGFGLELSAQYRTTNPNDGTAPVGEPTLVSKLHFEDFSSFSFPTDQSYYNPDSGAYESDFNIPVAGQPGTAYKFNISGQVGAGHLVGHLEGGDGSSSGADFDLVLNGPDIHDLAQKRETAGWENASISFEAKQVIDMGAGPAPSHIVLTTAFSKFMQPSDHFENVFLYDQKNIQVDWVLDGDVHVTFTSALWDQQTGEVVGNTPSASAAGVTQAIHCSGFYFVNQKTPFECDFKSNRTDQIHSVFKLCKKAGCS